MKEIFVQDLNSMEGSEIIDFFAVSEKSIRKSRNGKFFIRVLCLDKTGQVTGFIWDNVPQFQDCFNVGDIVKLKALVTTFEGNLQLSIRNIRKAEDNEFDIADFSPTTTKDTNKLLDRLFGFIDSVKNEYLSKLLHLFFDDKEFLEKYSKAPAAKNWHHNLVGGLLHHSTTVTTICDAVSPLYEEIDRDLLITCAILHDIGKIKEYTLAPFIDFTDEGRLIGHVVMGNKMVVDKCEEINNFPGDLLMKVEHLLLSHHGEREYGAAVPPKTKEALILHYADNLDAQVAGASDLIDKASEENSTWTDYHHLTNREYFTE
ncbi:MAG: HD domain-containing protein [Candidatus Cloacimonetes bacterium]|nr:HD domain-containing protein [Candidatus Cloacimonadota bacterium]